MLLFLKYSSFNFNFVFNESLLFMITNSNEKYFKNDLIFYLKLRKLNDIN